MAEDLYQIADATLASRHRVVKVTWQGKDVWVKKAEAQKAVFMIALQKLGARALKQDALQPSLAKGGAEGLKQEAAQIKIFRAAGFRVPEVLAMTDKWIALEDIGIIIDTELKTTPDMNADKLRAVLKECAEEIARLHNADLSHGRCKLNDLVRLKHGGIGFIDFEESTFDTPLHVWQARELLFFSMSVARYLPMSDDAVLYAIKCYREKSGYPEIFTRFTKIVKSFRILTSILSPFKKILGGDLKRMYVAVAQIDAAFK